MGLFLLDDSLTRRGLPFPPCRKLGEALTKRRPPGEDPAGRENVPFRAKRLRPVFIGVIHMSDHTIISNQDTSTSHISLRDLFAILAFLTTSKLLKH